MHRRAVVGIAVLALVVTVVAIAALASSRRPQVALVGDSITQISEQPMHRRLDPDYDVAVIGIPGATAPQLEGSVDAVLAVEPSQVVLNLGTNDVLQGRPLPDAIDSLRRQLDRFADVSCRHLVTVNEHMVSTKGDDLAGRARQLNDGIRRLADERGARIIDWAALVRTADADGSGPLTFDTVHPNEAGQARLADAYAQSLAAC